MSMSGEEADLFELQAVGDEAQARADLDIRL